MAFFGFGVILCLGALILWFIYTYNVFRTRQAAIDDWWDEADTYLRFRRDLIPSVLDRARPLMNSETATLDNIADIREKIVKTEIHPGTTIYGEKLEHLENSLSAEVRSLRDAFGKHRDVQVNSSLLTVMSELVSIEGKALMACQEYNKLTGEYNSSIKSFPANLVVGMLHFHPLEKRIFGDWKEDTASLKA